jgi:hypothetical protein
VKIRERCNGKARSVLLGCDTQFGKVSRRSWHHSRGRNEVGRRNVLAGYLKVRNGTLADSRRLMTDCSTGKHLARRQAGRLANSDAVLDAEQVTGPPDRIV